MQRVDVFFHGLFMDCYNLPQPPSPSERNPPDYVASLQ